MDELNLALVSDKSANGIAQEVQRLVSAGTLGAGFRLPPVREVARTIGVSPATVGQAWKLLAGHGTIETRGRQGTFVVEPESRQPWRQFRRVSGVDLPRDLSTGFPDPALLPDLAPYLEEVGRQHRYRAYESVSTLPELRQTLAEELPVDIGEDNVILATHVLGLMAEILPAIGGYRSRIIVGDPEFAPYLDLLERAGMLPCPVGLDEEGLRLDEVEAVIEAGATAMILQTRVHNPTGVPTSPERLRKLALLCAENDVLILESDYFGALSSTPRMSAARWAPDQTLYIRAFSKDQHPDIRVVAAVGSGRVVQSVLRRRVGGFDVSGINQDLLRVMLTDSEAREVTARAKAEYDSRRTAFVSELARNGIDVVSRDGFNVWVPVRNEQDALIHLAYHGISAAPGSAFQVQQAEPHLRVSIAGMADEAVPIAKRVAAAAMATRAKI